MKYSKVMYSISKQTSAWMLFALITIIGTIAFAQEAEQPPDPAAPLRVAVAGTAPFVINDKAQIQGISVEIWRDMAARAGWDYETKIYPSVPQALDALKNGGADVVVGPVSISSDRAQSFEFTQPYFQSSLSILAPEMKPTIWQRLSPFFSKAFFTALGILIFLLFVVGTLLWLAEGKREDSDFPAAPLPGIGNGMWYAIVTMTTVGYGDLAPKTALGRIVSASWMLISVVAATSLVAGIASTLSLSHNAVQTINTARDLSGHSVAILKDSPSQYFIKKYGATAYPVASLEGGYQALKEHKADAIVFDRPQLRYFLQNHRELKAEVSLAQYQSQGYGFAFPKNSTFAHQASVQLLHLVESGRTEKIVQMWLGVEDDE